MDIKLDEAAFKYYDENYAPLFLYIQKATDGGYEIVDVVNGTTEKIHYVWDSSQECRFCGKVVPKVSFKEKAHLFPESLGNKLFVSKNNECDSCNSIFSKYEVDLNTFLYPYLVLNNIRGKNGIKKYRSNDKSSRIEHANDGIKITDTIGKTKIQDDEIKKEIRYEFDVNSYSLSNVYRIMLKMALSILPEGDFKKFTIATDSLVNRKLIGREVLSLSFFPGFDRFEFTVIGYKKKVCDSRIPSYQFAIMNGDVLLQIPIYSDDDIRNLAGKSIQLDVIPVPTPFDSSPIMGNKKDHCYKIEDDAITPTSKQTFTLKYDSKTEL